MTNPVEMAKALARSGLATVRARLQQAGFLSRLLTMFTAAEVQPMMEQGAVKLDPLELFGLVLQGNASSPSPINQVLSAYAEIVKASPPGEPVVIVVDECNTLTEWGAEHAASVRALLRFFVQVSRQDGQAHVILATSDSAFIDWIKSGAFGL